MAANYANHTEIIDTDQNESITVTVPTSLASGDLWLVIVSMDSDAGAGMPNAPGGWAAVDAGYTDADGGTCTRAFWKVAGGSESSVAFTPSSGNWYDAKAYSIRITGAHASTPIGNVGNNFPINGGANLTPQSITIQETGNMAVLWLAGSASIAPITKPTGTTFMDDHESSWPAIEVAYQTGLSAGTYAPGAWTNTSADPAYCQTIEIRTAGAVSDTPITPSAGTGTLSGQGARLDTGISPPTMLAGT